MKPTREDLRDLVNNTSLEDSLRIVCRTINTLDQQGRKDLSIPLRKRYAQSMERGDAGLPCPFVFRVLEKECLSAWSSSLLSTEAPRPVTNTCWHYSLHTPHEAHIRCHPFHIERTDEHAFTFALDGSLNRIQQLAILNVIIGNTEQLQAGMKQIHPGLVDIHHASYLLSVDTVAATLNVTYYSHSQIDSVYRLSFETSTHADIFASKLQDIYQEERERPSALDAVLRKGWKTLFTIYEIPQDVSSPEAKELQKLWGISRSEIIGLYRSFRDKCLDEMAAPPLTEQRLRLLSKNFWSQFKHSIEQQYPGYTSRAERL